MNRIKELRESKKMTQVRLSIELEISQECVSAYEKERIYPGFLTLLKMSRLFGVSIDYIMGVSDYPAINRNLSDREQIVLSLLTGLEERKIDRIISYIEGVRES